MKTMATIPTDSRLVSGLIILLLLVIFETPSAQADDSEQQAKREVNFKASDAYGNGALTQAEFQDFINSNADDNIGHAAKLRSFGAYDRAFEKLDKDKSGTVTWSEVMDGLAAAN